MTVIEGIAFLSFVAALMSWGAWLNSRDAASSLKTINEKLEALEGSLYDVTRADADHERILRALETRLISIQHQRTRSENLIGKGTLGPWESSGHQTP
jgi:septal ring factor EnvC (AmiA/AmiB activator)